MVFGYDKRLVPAHEAGASDANLSGGHVNSYGKMVNTGAR